MKTEQAYPKYTIVNLLFIFLLFLTCAQEGTIVPINEPGSIIGIVKPFGSKAMVSLIQGDTLKTTNADSTTGIFRIIDISPGLYNLEFAATNYGRFVLNQVRVYPGNVTTVPDVILKPFPEQISTIYPADNASQFPLSESIEIKFNVLMNQSSVENNFSIAPQVSGYFIWEHTADYSTLHYQPSDQFVTNEYYTISLNKNAKTIYGDTLSFGVSSHFTTEGPKLLSSIPSNHSTYISPATTLHFTFNSKMDQQITEDSLVFEPVLIGDFKWDGLKRLTLEPGSYLRSDTEYQITGFPNLIDIYGSSLVGTTSIIFHTEPLKIVDHYPKNGASQVNRSNPIIITFNTYVDQTSAENAFSISPNPQNWQIRWDNMRQFQFRGTSLLNANSIYYVSIDTTCTDKWGKELPKEFSFIFSTGE